MAIVDGVPKMSARSLVNEATLHYGGRIQFTANAGGGSVSVTGLNTKIHNSATRYFLTPQNYTAARLMAYDNNTAVLTYGVWVECTDNGTLTVRFNAASGETGQARFHYLSFVGGRTLSLS